MRVVRGSVDDVLGYCIIMMLTLCPGVSAKLSYKSRDALKMFRTASSTQDLPSAPPSTLVHLLRSFLC